MKLKSLNLMFPTTACAGNEKLNIHNHDRLRAQRTRGVYGIVFGLVLLLSAGVVIAQQVGAVSFGHSAAANEDWTHGPYLGALGNYFADVDHDGRADAIVVNWDTVTVRRSNGSNFGPNEDWTHGPYYGSHGTFFADVTGDGWADAIVVNDDTVTVRRAMADCFIVCWNLRFGPNEDWTHGSYFGAFGTFFADVTGDGRADAIVLNADKLSVRASNGSSFGPVSITAEDPAFAFRGEVGETFFDMNADGKADLIMVNWHTIQVRVANGGGFNSPAIWADDSGGAPFFPNRGIAFASVLDNGSLCCFAHPVDPIMLRVTGANILVNRSCRIVNSLDIHTCSWPPEDWTTNPYVGSRGTFFADVTGDRQADAIVVNDDTITVRRAIP
jgi:hypothetical protein